MDISHSNGKIPQVSSVRRNRLVFMLIDFADDAFHCILAAPTSLSDS